MVERVAMGGDGSLTERKKERDETEEEEAGATGGTGAGGNYRQVVASLAFQLGIVANEPMLGDSSNWRRHRVMGKEEVVMVGESGGSLSLPFYTWICNFVEKKEGMRL